MISNQKNYDPRMHSAEHILNQTMIRIYGCERSFNNHIERKKSKCDYHFDHELSPTEVETIVEKVNEVIAQGLQVTEEFIPVAEAAKEFNLTKLPEDAGDTLRVVKIGEYDSCLCSGPHVENTCEIGEFRITTTSFEEGVLRVRFKLSQP